MNNSDEFKQRFAKLINLNEQNQLILDSIRFRDNDQSVKIGAVLAFSGLMIASSIVQLTAPSDSLLFVPKESIFLLFNQIGLIFLFASSFLALVGLTVTKKYSKDIDTALIEFDTLVNLRSRMSLWAMYLSIFGAFTVLISFFGVLLISNA